MYSKLRFSTVKWNVFAPDPSIVSKRFLCTWKQVPDFTTYEVSTNGFIRKVSNGRAVKQQARGSTVSVNLRHDDGYCRCLSVGRIVLSTFNPHSQSTTLLASHKDGNIQNNALSNLEWSDRKQIAREQVKRSDSGSLRSTVPVLVKMFDDGKEVFRKECQSINQCNDEINSFFHRKIKGQIQPLRTSIVHDKHPMSKKYCLISYVDTSKYTMSVKNLSENEKWAFFLTGTKKQEYFVSDAGRIKVRYSKSGRELLLKQVLDNGYYYKTFPVCRKYRRFAVHRLVGKHFVPNPKNYNMIDHIDGNKKNNSMLNLRWVKDTKENMNNPLTLAKRIDQRAVVQLDKNTGKVIRVWPNSYTAMKQLNVQSNNILRCCYGKGKTANGYAWAFLVPNTETC